MELTTVYSTARRPVRWLGAWLFWTVIALFYATRTGFPGQHLTWSQTVTAAMAQWYVWGILAPLIARANRVLPVSRDALIPRLLLNIPCSILFTVFYLYLNEAATALLNGGAQHFSFSLDVLRVAYRGAFHWDLLVYWVIVGGCISYDYQRFLREREVRTVELERMLAESRIETLRAQLHPHFLFNTLNAISAHVEHDGRTARRMLEELGELLRLSIAHSADQEISLDQEIAFVERYLNLQKVRFEDRMEVSLNVAPDVLDALVPTFLLQPLVENAVRHGISRLKRSGLVEVSAWQEQGRLHLRIRDNGPGLPTEWNPERGTGIGLSNTRERLQRLYGRKDQCFTIAGEPGRGVQVEISLPLRPAGFRGVAPRPFYAQHSHTGG